MREHELWVALLLLFFKGSPVLRALRCALCADGFPQVREHELWVALLLLFFKGIQVAWAVGFC